MIMGMAQRTRGKGKIHMSPGRYVSPSEKEAIVRAYLETDEYVKDIAKRFDIAIATVSNIVRDRGGSVRPKGRPRRGGSFIDSSGYRVLSVDPEDGLAIEMAYENGHVLEHRLVMARIIGRPLRDTETVHHINGDRSDNRPQNLQLRVGAHGKGVIMCCASCGSHDVIAMRIADSEVSQ